MTTDQFEQARIKASRCDYDLRKADDLTDTRVFTLRRRLDGRETHFATLDKVCEFIKTKSAKRPPGTRGHTG
jgi:hypothetical protein